MAAPARAFDTAAAAALGVATASLATAAHLWAEPAALAVLCAAAIGSGWLLRSLHRWLWRRGPVRRAQALQRLAQTLAAGHFDTSAMPAPAEGADPTLQALRLELHALRDEHARLQRLLSALRASETDRTRRDAHDTLRRALDGDDRFGAGPAQPLTSAGPPATTRVAQAAALAALLLPLALAAAALAWHEAAWRTRLQQAGQQALQQAWTAELARAGQRLDAALDARQRRTVPPTSTSPAPSPTPSPTPSPEDGLVWDLPGVDPATRVGVRLHDAQSASRLGPGLLVHTRALPDGRVLSVGTDLGPLLQSLQAGLGGPVALLSPRGLLLAGSPPPADRRVTLPLPGLDAHPRRPAALLQLPAAPAPLPPPSDAPLLAALLVLPLLPAAALAWRLHHRRKALEPALAALEALSLEHPPASEAWLHLLTRRGPAGRLARAAERLRSQGRALEALRDERQRVAAQHSRMIRRHLRRLAHTLDDSARDAVLGELGDEGTGDGQPQLARLATLLERLCTLVGTQQARLLQLLRELQDSVATREALAGLRQDLAIARRLQQAIVPRGTPPLPGVRLAATMVPAHEVGGDFHDAFALDDHRLALVMADVSGKGVPAAYFAAIARTRLRTMAAFVDDPAQLVARLNDALAAENDEALFVTLFYAVVDLASGTMVSVNAGHNPPLLRRADGRVLTLPMGRNPVLGVDPGRSFAADHDTLRPGDALLVYTDGITEAQDQRGALFGVHALQQLLALDDADPLPRIVDAVRRFEGGAAQADDLTAMWVRREG